MTPSLAWTHTCNQLNTETTGGSLNKAAPTLVKQRASELVPFGGFYQGGAQSTPLQRIRSADQRIKSAADCEETDHCRSLRSFAGKVRSFSLVPCQQYNTPNILGYFVVSPHGFWAICLERTPPPPGFVKAHPLENVLSPLLIIKKYASAANSVTWNSRIMSDRAVSTA